ncbi:MAG TPA: glycoside hydrolase family 3 N-terminal domain-containing protein, partial [Polyangiaceae bacterium]
MSEIPADAPFRDPEAPLEARIDDLLSRMTLEEKVRCLDTNPSLPRFGIVASGHVEGLHGLSQGGPGKWGKDDPIPTTTFPQAIGLGETWDPELVRAAAALEGHEARFVYHRSNGERGGIVVRAPNADIGRDPRWGRTEECYGEDAYFNGVMTQAFVRGLQGDHPRYWQAASLMKHFLANSNENERGRSSSSFDERLFREYYSLPFRKGIEAGSRAFMAAYNKYNGVPCHVHPVLEDIARREWGQDGIICTDGGGFQQLLTLHRWYPTLAEAAQAVLYAGIGQFLDEFEPAVNDALARGLVTEADVERTIRPNFRVMIRLGLLDPPER